jgi:hypothetical protein
VRLRSIAQRIIPHTYEWNPRAREWRWEVNLIGSRAINAFCMPGGKIAFFVGILEQLKLTDDEVAMVMGHEMAHALREHAREQMGKTMATRGAIEIGAAIFGLGNAGRLAAGMGGQLLTLRFGREDESEADLVGLELAARAGFNPQAGVTLWHKDGRCQQKAARRNYEHAPDRADPDPRHRGQHPEGARPSTARCPTRRPVECAQRLGPVLIEDPPCDPLSRRRAGRPQRRTVFSPRSRSAISSTQTECGHRVLVPFDRVAEGDQLRSRERSPGHRDDRDRGRPWAKNIGTSLFGAARSPATVSASGR